MRSISGSRSPRPQRLLAAALGLVAAGVAGPAGVPHGPAVAAQEPTPWVEEDFSTYHSTADLLADPRGIYSGGNKATRSQITLDRSVALPGLTQSMRYTWPDRSRSARRCNSYVVGRDLDFPQPTTEVWVEVYTRFSDNFTTVEPTCRGRSNPGYKFLFGRVTKAPRGDRSPGRFNLEVGVFGDVTQWNPPYNVSRIYQGYPRARDLFDGRWHRWRLHMRVAGQGGTGVAVLYFDDRLIKDYGPIPINRAAITGLALGRNTNQGPPHPQSLNWGRIRVWNQNPGWGF